MVQLSTTFGRGGRADLKRLGGRQAVPQESKNPAEQLEQVIESAHRVLFHAKTVFPFDLFPSEIIIDENKVDISYGMFLNSREVFSIPIQNINGAVSSIGLLLGTLELETDGYSRKPEPIRKLWRKDALKARRIITGLITVYRQDIDMSSFDRQTVLKKLEEIGRTREPRRYYPDVKLSH